MEKEEKIIKKFYTVWKSMISRCRSNKNSSYRYYGGRGIKVSKEWQEYSNFMEDMFDEYYNIMKDEDITKRNFIATLDRIDSNGDYCKENCRWVDIKTQIDNRRQYMYPNSIIKDFSKQISR